MALQSVTELKYQSVVSIG